MPGFLRVADIPGKLAKAKKFSLKSGCTRAMVNIQHSPPISPPQPFGNGPNLIRPRVVGQYAGNQDFNTSDVNSEFHGDRFACGGEERRVGMLGWDFQDGLFVVVEAEVEGLLHKTPTCLSAG
ncbi:uncharacterized protein LACBIDRAFT_321164 [Laccaria bicolor S238N-H82]|uniref:Predicted protein n=1 Tax=Laccaria bicolor (strain S238N-H82 / ATCC MYA-4686) TaxID=486041 RepID=B0CNZ0_LACBS|nr:uncharacterized protein LACBIDRAFT_321164 [Laccaria bicolor S238N-H82]EDR16021.1 predicted protein [Laccaria bicolor S238N-H82]|eukprot:XP_001874229.1 predicted protein [Laccaria bicolor S238N-H82]